MFSNGTVTKSSVSVPTNYSNQIEGIIPINTTEYFVSAEENDTNSQGLYRLNVSTLNIGNFDEDSLSFYPNPAQNSIIINKEDCIAKFYSITGKLVKTSRNSTINISELSTGIYLVQIQDSVNNNFEIKRLIVE